MDDSELDAASLIKINAVREAVMSAERRLGMPAQMPMVLFSNEAIVRDRCPDNVKMIVVSDDKLTVCERYSEPGAPFFIEECRDLEQFLRACLDTRMIRDASRRIDASPEFARTSEKQGTPAWNDFVQRKNAAKTVAYQQLVDLLVGELGSADMKHADALLFGR